MKISEKDFDEALDDLEKDGAIETSTNENGERFVRITGFLKFLGDRGLLKEFAYGTDESRRVLKDAWQREHNKKWQ